MDCREHEKRFEKYFDREISALEYKALRSHLGRCSRCREAFLDHLLTMDFLSAMPSEEPSEQLAARIMSNIPAAKRTVEWRRWATGIAACVLLALSLTVVDRMTSRNDVEATLSSVGGKIPFSSDNGRVILPRGTVLKGDMVVKGDLIIIGKVYGKVQADRVVKLQAPQPADPFGDLWQAGQRLLTGGTNSTH